MFGTFHLRFLTSRHRLRWHMYGWYGTDVSATVWI